MPAKFRCQFEMDNAAFHDPDGDYGDECERILLNLAPRIRTQTGGKIRDINGNTIGSWSIR